jgi:hypothetical protein
VDTWRIYARVGPEDRQAKVLVVGSLACVIGFQIEGLCECYHLSGILKCEMQSITNGGASYGESRL